MKDSKFQLSETEDILLMILCDLNFDHHDSHSGFK